MKSDLSTKFEWKVLDSAFLLSDAWLTVRSDRCEMPDGRVVDPYHVIELPGWVNIVAITKDKDVILVREYRHGLGRVMVGLPSGTIEETDSSPEVAARRELREETGYGEGQWFRTSTHAANPARQNNLVHCFIALNVEKMGMPNNDHSEQVEVLMVKACELISNLGAGEIEFQGLHLAAIFAACIYSQRDGRLADIFS